MTVTIDMSEVKKTLARLNQKEFRRAINSSLNKTGRRERALISRKINRQYNIKVGDIKKYMKYSLSKTNTLQVKIDIDSKRRNAIHFGSKQNKKGVSVRINKQSGRKTISATNRHGGAFIRNGVVFQRIKGTKNKRNSREKLRAVTTLSASQMFKRDMAKSIRKDTIKHFPKVFQKDAEWYFGLK